MNKKGDTPHLFNRSTGLAMVCPITNTIRGFPFHVPIPKDSQLTGFIMVEEVTARFYQFEGPFPIHTQRCVKRKWQHRLYPTSLTFWILSKTFVCNRRDSILADAGILGADVTSADGHA
jgi:hypothetical protein